MAPGARRWLLRCALATAVLGYGLAADPLAAEEAGMDPTGPDAAAAPADAATQRPRAGQPSPARRAERQQRLKAWWVHAHEILFSGIDLDAGQARGVDGIIETQLGKRERFAQLDADLKAARRQGDKERSAAIRVELRAANAQLKQQHELFEEMRALLTEEQRPIFDMNRARLVAEDRANHKARQEKRD